MPATILFDIDGTLLYTRGIGRHAFGEAFAAAYGMPYPHLADLCFVGATDSDLLCGMIQRCGAPNTIEQEERFYQALAQATDTALAQNQPYIYPGVLALTAGLRDRGHTLGIVTGNIRATAWSKLRHAGLDHLFALGAYGDEHADRKEIARLAIARAPQQAAARLLVGDTPLDVAAARANGLQALAVATGWVGTAELEAAGADLVVEDFADTATRLAQIEALL